MRTYKWMAAIVLLLGMTSCGTYYRMVSQVNSDGSMHREVYAYGDSAFLAGEDRKSTRLNSSHRT